MKKFDGIVGGTNKLNSAVSRTQLKALADAISQAQDSREKEMRSSVEVMVSVWERVCGRERKSVCVCVCECLSV